MAEGESPPHFRRTERLSFALSVTFRASEHAELRHSAHLVDLSMGGAQLRCEQPPDVDAQIWVEIRVPSMWEPLELAAEVRWVDRPAYAEPCFGVRFERLRRSQAAPLYELLRTSKYAESAR